MSRRDTPEVRQRRGSAQPVQGRCGAQLVLTDPPRYCTQWPRKGRTTCKFHGGNNRVGVDAPTFKNGMYSRYGYLSPAVAEVFQQVMRDERLFDLTEDVALLEVAKQDAAQDWEFGATAEAWGELRELLTQLRTCTTDEQRAPVIDHMASILFGGTSKAKARDALAQAVERKSRLVAMRQRLMVETEDLIPAKRVAVVMAGIANLVREFLPDATAQAEFTRRFVSYVGPRLQAPREIEGEKAGNG